MAILIEVITADLWPNICWTILMSAPLAMARLAAVWRSSCGWKPGINPLVRCCFQARDGRLRAPSRGFLRVGARRGARAVSSDSAAVAWDELARC